MPKLVLMNGERAGAEFALAAGREWVLGREEDCDVMLRNVPGVSRHHAKFREENGQWVVEDQNSQNGIYINKEKVTRKVLQDQDVMWFSNASVRFETAPVDPGKNIYFEKGSVEGKPATANQEPPTTDGKPGGATAGPAAAGGPAAAPAAAPAAERVLPAGAQPPRASSLRAAAPEPAEPESRTEVRSGPEATGIDPEQIRRVRQMAAGVEREFGKVIVGQREVLEQLLVALLASGHCLMIGLPGLAKTLMVSTLSAILELKFKRIQFTPDLMPSDIVGSDVLEVDEESGRKSFRFIEGPIFTNMLLADEINRTPPKTQAALLEAMQERQVTAANHRFPLPKPFFVLATQNPLEQEGTYPLPEAQLDRFMFNIVVSYPTETEEEEIVLQTTRKSDQAVARVLSGQELLTLQDLVRELPVSKHVVKYATRLTRSTRPGEPGAPDFIKAHISCGAGPRAAQFLILGAKARAVLKGSLNVSCDDVRALALPILRHRLFTNFTADSEGVTPDELVKRLLLSVPEPGAADY